MKRIRALGSVLVALVAVTAAALALAPSKGEAQDISRAVAGGTLRTLAPSQIIMEVRRAGFKPISRPVQRGPVYVVSALDGDQFDVNLTLDAYSGRLLWVADIGRTRFGSYYGYPAWPYRARPLVPPADIANSGPDMNIRPNRTAVRSAPRAAGSPGGTHQRGEHAKRNAAGPGSPGRCGGRKAASGGPDDGPDRSVGVIGERRPGDDRGA
jgi:hypothetical protein